ncbi:MAG TPA: hypothetical protein VK869_10935 [Rubrobacteraceae bacterium]|nr:hypothetical protein [Rubrobacteraceae bacterium]
MSAHWRLAVRGAILTLALALLAGTATGYYLDLVWAGAFLYGVGVGIVSFASIALTVSLLTVRPTALKVLLGAASYVGRLLFAALAILVPAYMELLPALPMVVGFAGVYVIENVVLLLLAPRSVGVGRNKGAERRAEA